MNSNLPKSTSSTTGSGDPRVGKYDIIATGKLRPHPDNPRKHPRAQIQAIANSILVFGLNAPLIIDRHNQIRAGHGRYEAAKLLGIKELPVVYLEHLRDEQATGYMLAQDATANARIDIGFMGPPLLYWNSNKLPRIRTHLRVQGAVVERYDGHCDNLHHSGRLLARMLYVRDPASKEV